MSTVVILSLNDASHRLWSVCPAGCRWDLCVCVCVDTRVCARTCAYSHFVRISALVGRSFCVPVSRVRTPGIRQVQTPARHSSASRTGFGPRRFTPKAPCFLSPMPFVTVQCCPQDRPVDMSFYPKAPRAGLVRGWTLSPQRAGSAPTSSRVFAGPVCGTWLNVTWPHPWYWCLL